MLANLLFNCAYKSAQIWNNCTSYENSDALVHHRTVGAVVALECKGLGTILKPGPAQL